MGDNTGITCCCLQLALPPFDRLRNLQIISQSLLNSDFEQEVLELKSKCATADRQADRKMKEFLESKQVSKKLAENISNAKKSVGAYIWINSVAKEVKNISALLLLQSQSKTWLLPSDKMKITENMANHIMD